MSDVGKRDFDRVLTTLDAGPVPNEKREKDLSEKAGPKARAC